MADKRVSFSNEQLPIKEIETYFLRTEKALKSFYQINNPLNNPSFINFTSEELENEREQMIEELDKSTAFTI
jgi:hypothetical protein